MAPNPTNSALTPMRTRIRRALGELNISAREASRRAGFNVGYVGDLLEGRSKAPEADRIMKLAEALEIPTAELFDSAPSDVAPMPRPQPGAMIPLPEMLPVLQVKFGVSSAFAVIEPRPAKMIERLPSLRYVADAYAFVVPNDLNAPRYFAGETVFVSTAEAVKAGDFVFVRFADGTGGVTRVDRMDGAKIHFKTLNTTRATTHEIASISAVHKIVATATD